MTDDARTVSIKVETPWLADNMWTIRIAGDPDSDLRAMFEAAGLHTGGILEHSAVTEAAIVFGVFVQANGIDQIAAVLSSFFSRNQHKKVHYYPNGVLESTEGMSEREHARLLRDLKAMQDVKLASIDPPHPPSPPQPPGNTPT